jgi:hypothetical protein
MQAFEASESRLAPLYSKDALITGANNVAVAQHITRSLAQAGARPLNAQPLIPGIA